MGGEAPAEPKDSTIPAGPGALPNAVMRFLFVLRGLFFVAGVARLRLYRGRRPNSGESGYQESLTALSLALPILTSDQECHNMKCKRFMVRGFRSMCNTL